MSYNITCSTKILTLTIAPSFNFKWSSLWICYCPRCVRFTAPSGRVGALFFLRRQMYTFGRTFIKKDLNLCLPLNYYAKIIVELGKIQKRNSTVLRCYAYNQTKYFAISINVIEHLFLLDILKLLAMVANLVSISDRWFFILCYRWL